MIQLHYYPSTAAMMPHILLEEIGVPYQRVLVDRMKDAHKAPDYLQLNPNGLIPVLIDGDLVLYETAAICLHLSDTHPQAGLAPPLGSPERAHGYKWLMWLTNTRQCGGRSRGQGAGRTQDRRHAGPARRRIGAPWRALVCRRWLQPARRLCVHPVPLDA
jgi:glutathione S-transferase